MFYQPWYDSLFRGGDRDRGSDSVEISFLLQRRDFRPDTALVDGYFIINAIRQQNVTQAGDPDLAVRRQGNPRAVFQFQR